MEYMELQRTLLLVRASGVLSGYKGTTFLVYIPHFPTLLKPQRPHVLRISLSRIRGTGQA